MQHRKSMHCSTTVVQISAVSEASALTHEYAYTCMFDNNVLQ